MATCGSTFNLSAEKMLGFFFLEVFYFYCNSNGAFYVLLLIMPAFKGKTMIGLSLSHLVQ